MNKNELKGLIQTNVQGKIGGAVLQNTLKAMAENLWCGCGSEQGDVVEYVLTSDVSNIIFDTPLINQNRTFGIISAKTINGGFDSRLNVIHSSIPDWLWVNIAHNPGPFLTDISIVAYPNTGSERSAEINFIQLENGNPTGKEIKITVTQEGVGEIQPPQKQEVARGNFGLNPTNGLLWRLFDDGEFRVTLADSNTTGEGTWNDYTAAGRPWHSRRSSITFVVIEDGVKNIGNYAFAWCANLTSITIPDSVTSIGNYAFSECAGLTSVSLPNLVTDIGIFAFDRCFNLISANIGNSVTSIRSSVFANCYNLSSIIIPDSVMSIGNNAFIGCTSLTSVIIPNSVTIIEGQAFDRSGLTSVTIGNSVISIGAGAFNQTGLISVTIPNSVTSIGDSAFRETGLTFVTFGNSVSSIGAGAFYGCTGLTEVIIPNSVSSIENNTFALCTSLISVTIPNSVTSIGNNVFDACASLMSITIPNSVTSIGNGAFVHCTSLTSIIIGNSVTSIGEWAFQQCANLTDITVHAVTPPSLGTNALWAVPPTAILRVPSESIFLYKVGDDYSAWGWFESIVAI